MKTQYRPNNISTTRKLTSTTTTRNKNLNSKVLNAKNKIEIMAGSGINEHNAHLFNTMVDAIHFTVHNKNKKQENTDYINIKKIEKIKSMINLQ